MCALVSYLCEKVILMHGYEKMDLVLRKKLLKCYIWSIALYDAETRTLREVDQIHPKCLEMWCWRRVDKISWTDQVTIE
jgi:hypothetical protein